MVPLKGACWRPAACHETMRRVDKGQDAERSWCHAVPALPSSSSSFCRSGRAVPAPATKPAQQSNRSTRISHSPGAHQSEQNLLVNAASCFFFLSSPSFFSLLAPWPCPVPTPAFKRHHDLSPSKGLPRHPAFRRECFPWLSCCTQTGSDNDEYKAVR